MAFTPTSGLMMGTRPGDLDPGLLVYLMKDQKISTEDMDKFVSQQCGLIGVSETSSDMRDLLADTQQRSAPLKLCSYSATRPKNMYRPDFNSRWLGHHRVRRGNRRTFSRGAWGNLRRPGIYGIETRFVEKTYADAISFRQTKAASQFGSFRPMKSLSLRKCRTDI